MQSFELTAGAWDRGAELLLVSKAACAGIVFILLTTWISGPHPTLAPSRANLSNEVPGDSHPSDVSKMQQTLQDKGHYRGKVDGAFGLRTRASIRAYQKAENLLVTGQLDVQTAVKLGVTPESHDQIGDETTRRKPSAGRKWAKGSRSASKTPRKVTKKSATLQSGQGHREKTLQAENDKHEE